MPWPGGKLTRRAHTSAVDWEVVERGNNEDLVMPEESHFPSSSAQAKPALDMLLPRLVLMLRMPWLLVCLLPVQFFILRGRTGG